MTSYLTGKAAVTFDLSSFEINKTEYHVTLILLLNTDRRKKYRDYRHCFQVLKHGVIFWYADVSIPDLNKYLVNYDSANRRSDSGTNDAFMIYKKHVLRNYIPFCLYVCILEKNRSTKSTNSRTITLFFFSVLSRNTTTEWQTYCLCGP